MREGWDEASLGKVCDLVKRGVAPKYIESNGVCVINQKCIRNHEINLEQARCHDIEAKSINPERYIKFGDVLVNSTGTGTLGRVAQVRKEPIEPTTVDTHVTIVRPTEGLFYPEFFGYMMIKIEEEITASGEGASGQTELPRSKLENDFKVSYPKSVDEQKRIVAILDEAFAGIDTAIANTERNLANVRELFESYLNYLLNDVASSESIQTLDCITEIIIDCEHKTAPTQETGFPSIRTPNIGKGYLILDGVNRVSEETYSLWTRRGEPAAGDLILAREAPAGNVGVIPEGEKVCLGQRTVLIRPNKEIVLSKYLAYLILHPVMQRRLLSYSTGATVQHVNMRDIRALKLARLPELHKQIEDVEVLEDVQIQVSRLEEVYKEKVDSLNDLKQSLLQKAFSGELTAEPEKFVDEAVA